MKRSRENKTYVDLEQVRGRREGYEEEREVGKSAWWRGRAGCYLPNNKADVFVENIATGEGYR